MRQLRHLNQKLLNYMLSCDYRFAVEYPHILIERDALPVTSNNAISLPDDVVILTLKRILQHSNFLG